MDLLSGPSRSKPPLNTPRSSVRSSRRGWRASQTPQSSHRSTGFRSLRGPSTPQPSLHSSLPPPTLYFSDFDGESLIIPPDGIPEEPPVTPPPWYEPERRLIAIKFVYFFVYANTACLIPYFVTYYYEWGLTPTELSLIQALVPFFGFLVRPIIGRLADVTNRHRAVFAACCLWCGFFHIPHMFVPKLTPPDGRHCQSGEGAACDNWQNSSLVGNLTSTSTTTTMATTTVSTSGATFSDPERLPTLTLLLGLRLVAYAGQAPTQDLADAFCYAATDRDPRRWGRQRIWSTVGWAVATFSVGYVLNELGSHYWLFVITAVFNIFAAISIAFLEPLVESSTPSVSTARSHRSHSHRANSQNFATSGASSRFSNTSFDTISRAVASVVEPQVTLTMLLKQTHVQVYLLFSMLSGSLLATEFSFLLIFIKDSGGDELLIGLHQVVDSLSEFPLFLFSGYIITWLGFVPCFCLSFCTYILRLICYSFLSDPLYLVLLVETVHCFSFTLYVAAGTGYADSITAPGLAATLQSVFQGVFFGLGIGAGNLIGGFLYPVIGPRWLFRGAAVMAAVCAVSYAIIYRSGVLKSRPPPSTANATPILRLSTSRGPSLVGVASADGTSLIFNPIDDLNFDAASTTTSNVIPTATLLSTPTPTRQLFLAPDGLHRSPGSNRVPMIVMMTPLTARIIAKDGVIRFIDD